jgi:pimeloyl-ACP methyl ester carboxylesterase
MSSWCAAGLRGMTDQSTSSTDQAVQTHVVGAGDEAITYDVHGDLAGATPDRPVLLMFGSPMDAMGFGTLASHFTDRPVVTYDPRGTGRNPTGTSDVPPEQHADDLHRVIEALGAGPVDAFGSSGGAVNVLALAAAHPEDFRRVVAHEPPTADLLPDRANVLAAIEDIKATYHGSGNGHAMAKFIALVMRDGLVPDDYVDQPAPDPANFGLPAEDDGSRDNPLMRNMPSCNEFRVDADALAALGDRLLIAVGEKSGDQIAGRGGRAVAEQLGLPVTGFPGDHAGYLGGEYGQHGEPEAFAARLRSVLD